MIVEWMAEAIADLSAIRAFISEENPAAAQRHVTSIILRVETALPSAPGIGRPGRVIGTREFIISGTPYIVPYRLRESSLQVLRVYHGARRWQESF